jgi:hypothetical protein
MRLIPLCAAALLLAGCAQSSIGTLGNTIGASSARPKMVIVTDFVISPDVLIVDRGFTARLERKIGAFPTHERKQRTLERVNDEIVATLIATLREAGLEAEPGSEEGLSLSESAVLVKGSLRPSDPAAKKNEAGLVGTKSAVTADVSLSSFSSFGRKQLLAFIAEPSGAKPATGKSAAATNALIAQALAANKAAPEKLSGDVEAAARRIGRGAGEKIVAYGKTQGWFESAGEPVADAAKPEPVRQAAAPEAPKPAAATPAAAKPAAKPRAKPAPKPEMVPDSETELDGSPSGD